MLACGKRPSAKKPAALLFSRAAPQANHPNTSSAAGQPPEAKPAAGQSAAGQSAAGQSAAG